MVFNHVMRGFAAQGWRRSLSKTGACRYRGEGGCKCAIGHLIPDSRYSPDIEGNGISERVISSLFSWVDPGSVRLRVWQDNMKWLDALQSAHDNAVSDVALRPVMVEFAHDHGLKWPEDVE